MLRMNLARDTIVSLDTYIAINNHEIVFKLYMLHARHIYIFLLSTLRYACDKKAERCLISTCRTQNLLFFVIYMNSAYILSSVMAKLKLSILSTILIMLG